MFLLLTEKHNKKQFVLPRPCHQLKEIAAHPGQLAFASQSKIPVEDEEAPASFSKVRVLSLFYILLYDNNEKCIHAKKTCDDAEKAILAKKNLRKKCAKRDKM